MQDCGKPYYLENYLIFFGALRAAYPHLRLISNCHMGGNAPTDTWDWCAGRGACASGRRARVAVAGFDFVSWCGSRLPRAGGFGMCWCVAGLIGEDISAHATRQTVTGEGQGQAHAATKPRRSRNQPVPAPTPAPPPRPPAPPRRHIYTNPQDMFNKRHEFDNSRPEKDAYIFASGESRCSTPRLVPACSALASCLLPKSTLLS